MQPTAGARPATAFRKASLFVQSDTARSCLGDLLVPRFGQLLALALVGFDARDDQSEAKPTAR